MEFVWPLISVVTLLVGFFVARSLVSKQVDGAQEEVARLREEVSGHQAEAVSLRKKNRRSADRSLDGTGKPGARHL